MKQMHAITLLVMVLSAPAGHATPGVSLREFHDPEYEAPIHDPDLYRQQHQLELHPRNRPVGFDVQHYDLDVSVNPESGEINGRVRIHVQSLRQNLTTLELDALGMDLQGVSDGTRQLGFLYDGRVITVDLGRHCRGEPPPWWRCATGPCCRRGYR